MARSRALPRNTAWSTSGRATDESPNQGLVERHKREIAPLLKRRWLFAESTNFLLYDFWTDDGTVDENVFAYSNRAGNERALILYNNRYGETHGTIHLSAAAMEKATGGLRQTRLGDGLVLSGYDTIVAYRDTVAGLEYLRRAIDFHHHGLTLGLHRLRTYGFARLARVAAIGRLSLGQPLRCAPRPRRPSVDSALSMLRLRPLHDALHRRSVRNPSTPSPRSRVSWPCRLGP